MKLKYLPKQLKSDIIISENKRVLAPVLNDYWAIRLCKK